MLAPIARLHFYIFVPLVVVWLIGCSVFDSSTMDSDDKMTIHHFMEEETNVAVNEDEQLTILVCHLQLQAGELNNVAPGRGGSNFGRRKSKGRRGWRVMAICRLFCRSPNIYLKEILAWL
jgi:hypothetical protein